MGYTYAGSNSALTAKEKDLKKYCAFTQVISLGNPFVSCLEDDFSSFVSKCDLIAPPWCHWIARFNMR